MPELLFKANCQEHGEVTGSKAQSKIRELQQQRMAGTRRAKCSWGFHMRAIGYRPEPQ